MFRSLTILRELVQSLVKVTLLLKHSVKLRHCILCRDVAANGRKIRNDFYTVISPTNALFIKLEKV